MAMPESIRMRSRGTAAMPVPSARKYTSTEYSLPGSHSCNRYEPSCGSASSASRLCTSCTPRPPAPRRGLANTGNNVRLDAAVSASKRGTVASPACCAAVSSSSLSAHSSSARSGDSGRWMPCAANSWPSRASGTSSASTVEITSSMFRRWLCASTWRAKSGASPRGTIRRCAAGTRNNPLAQGSMSAMKIWCSAPRLFQTLMAEGPPAPVINIFIIKMDGLVRLPHCAS